MKGIVRERILALTVVAFAGMAATSPVVQAGELYVFGDSLSDTGNLFIATGGTNGSVFTTDPSQSPRLPTPPFYEGRASNGPVWIEHFATRLGMGTPLPGLGGGTNYAFAGATTGPESTSPYPIPNIKTQLQLYLGGASTAAADDLFVVWGGANDFFYGQTDSTVPVANIVTVIETLHSEVNASRFLVPNLPPLGKTPTGFLQDPTGLNLLTDQFNTLLNTQLDALRDSLGVTLYEFDVHTQFENMLTDPAAYGLTNVTESALAVETNPSLPEFGFPTYPYTLQPDSAEFLFFDGMHPTALGHALIAEAAAASVPEPSAWVLFSVGLILLAVRGWWPMRRKRLPRTAGQGRSPCQVLA